MKRSSCAICALALLLLVPVGSSHAEVTVYVVRHADRDKDRDGEKLDRLNDEGAARAQELADLMETKGVDAIFSTEWHRTQATAWPLADRLDKPIESYDGPRELRTRLRRIRRNDPHAVVLVLGHSNTVPEIVTKLGAALPAGLPLTRDGFLDEDDYDNLVILTFDDRGRPEARHAIYGAPTPPP